MSTGPKAPGFAERGSYRRPRRVSTIEIPHPQKSLQSSDRLQ